MKSIKIACKGADELPLSAFEEFQGNLKSLSESAYKKLKRNILDRGFSFPIHIWKSGEAIKIIDGHQRIRCLWEMAKEGYKIPSLPVVYVHAKDEKEARLKILSGASQFGKVDRQGLYEFMEMSEIQFEDLALAMELPAVDTSLFEAEFYKDPAAQSSPGGEPSYTSLSEPPSSEAGSIPAEPEPTGRGDSSSSERVARASECEPSSASHDSNTRGSFLPRDRTELTYEFLPEEKQEILAFSDDLMKKWELDSHAAVIHHAIIQAHKKHCRNK